MTEQRYRISLLTSMGERQGTLSLIDAPEDPHALLQLINRESRLSLETQAEGRLFFSGRLHSLVLDEACTLTLEPDEAAVSGILHTRKGDISLRGVPIEQEQETLHEQKN